MKIMINLDRVTQTRRQYKVLQTMYCPTNEPSERIIACIVDDEGGSEAIGYFIDGSYLEDRESGMDLVEDSLYATPIAKPSVLPTQNANQVAIKQCLEAIRSNIDVCLRELD